MFCLKCGKEIDNSATTCPFCGCVTENSEIDTGVSLELNNENASTNSIATAGIIVSAIGIVVAWLLAFLGYIISAAGLILPIKIG